MWFLDVDIFFKMIIACLVVMFSSLFCTKVLKKNISKHLLLPFDIIIIGFVSIKLCVFYVAYTLITFGFVKIMKNAKSFRKSLFVILCLLCTLPFFYTRALDFYDFLPKIFVLVGFSYNMLKAIDALYFTYYTDMDIPLYTYANYIMFFPVVTSGPIFRYRDFEKTFNMPQEITGELCAFSVKKVIRGLFKKMVVLFFVSEYLSHIVEKGEFNIVTSLVIITLSYITLYLDLSGYSDVAIGLGSIMGIKVPENFKKPWCSPSFTVFWRNWHVTLSDYIREHIFVVLNGKKLNRFVSAIIGFVTMVVMALWHGFTTPFVVSGVYNGLLLAIENLFGITKADKKKNKAVFCARCVLVSFLFGINSMIFLFDFATIKSVLLGLVSQTLPLVIFVVALVIVFAIGYVLSKFESTRKFVSSYAFVLMFVAVVGVADVYYTYNNPFIGNHMFCPDDFEITQYHHPEREWDRVLFGNSVVIFGYNEQLSDSEFVNLGIDCGKITDLEQMLKKGHIKVGSQLAIGMNYLTFYDNFDTNPSYIWHKKWYQPIAYFHRDKINSALDGIITRLKGDHPQPFAGYYKYPFEKAVYYGNLTSEQLAEKEKIYTERYYNLPQDEFDDNMRALGEVAKFCKKNDIQLLVFWMPWNPDAAYPELCDNLKQRVDSVLSQTDVEVYDLTNALDAKYFHDTGHIEYNEGAPVFTQMFDNLVKEWNKNNK